MSTRDTAWPTGTPCWSDLQTSDQDAAQDFYRALFGWRIDVGGPDTNRYGMATVDGRPVGGVMKMPRTDHPSVWTTYLATADADATAAAIEAAGGTVLMPVTDVLGLGRMSLVAAPGGGVFGTWQEGTHFGYGVANEAGSVTWNEFFTRDYATARDFFAEAFGWTYTEIFPGYSTVEVEGNTVGGLGTMPAEVPDGVPPHWRVYFQVGDCDAAVARVVELGGSVLRPAADMPYGRHADVADPQGAMFTVITPAPRPE